MIYTASYNSPYGELILGDFDGRLCLCDWHTEGRDFVRRRVAKALNESYIEGSTPLLQATIRQLDEYFNHDRTEFELPLRLCGTPFQLDVWDMLTKISYGQTVTYGELAHQMHRPNSCRAVASAARANAISIIIPCHRLIGTNNQLTGYAGGLAAKHRLIALEHM